MAKRKAAKRAPEPVDETTEDYWDEEESSTSTSELSWSDLSSFEAGHDADSSVSVASGGGQPPPIRQRKMKTVKPKPLRTLMGNDLSKPRKRKITLLQE